jgi:hypothetical protein
MAGYNVIVVKALGNSLGMIGSSGARAIDRVLLERYGLKREDLVSRPSSYMDALKNLLGSSASVLESSMLDEITRETGIKAGSMEEAVRLLRIRNGN